MVRLRSKYSTLFLILLINLLFIGFVTVKLNYKNPVKNNDDRSLTSSVDIIRKIKVQNSNNTETLIKMRERIMDMNNACLKFGKNTEPLDFKPLKNTQWPWIYVSHKYKLLYCQLPKVGTSNWLQIFSWLESESNTTDPVKQIHGEKLLLLSYLKPGERERVMNTYTKYTVVREPFTRSLSAYKDKFIPHKGAKASVFKALAEKIVLAYRNITKTQPGYSPSYVPTFEEYVKYLVDPKNDNIPTHYSEPRHWEPQSDLCYPCNIRYDFLLKIENVESESEAILEYINAPNYIKYPRGNLPKNSSSEQQYHSLNDEYYSKVKPELVNKLYHYYKNDYDLFGYDPPPQF